MEEWKATDPVPAELRSSVPGMREEAKASLVPASGEEMAIFLGMLNETAGALAWPQLLPGAPRIYVAALADVPPDLLALALNRLIRDWKWPRLPTPADIRATIAEEISRRKLRLTRLRTVEIFGGR